MATCIVVNLATWRIILESLANYFERITLMGIGRTSVIRILAKPTLERKKNSPRIRKINTPTYTSGYNFGLLNRLLFYFRLLFMTFKFASIIASLASVISLMSQPAIADGK